MPEETTSTAAVMDAPATGLPDTSGERQSTTLRNDDPEGHSVDELWGDSIKDERLPPETAPEQEEPVQTGQVPPAQPANRVEQLIAEHAKKLGVNPTDPAYKGILKQLADKDLFIEQLQGKNGANAAPADAASVPVTADAYLTEFERELGLGPQEAEEAKAPPTTEAQTAATAAPLTGLPRFGDIGDQWKDQKDAYKAMEKAWLMPEGDDKYQALAEIQNAISARQNLVMVPGIVRAMLQQPEITQQIIAAALGPEFVGQVVPELRSALQAKRDVEDRDFSIEQLKRNDNFKGLDEVFKPEDGELEFEGAKFPNNALNRIMVENPWIFSIGPRTGIQDPRAAARLGMMDRYRAVFGIYQKEQAAKHSIDPAKAAEIMKAGQETERRSANDRTRQGLNSGSGATTAPGNKGRADSYIAEIQRASRGNSLSIDDL